MPPRAACPAHARATQGSGPSTRAHTRHCLQDVHPAIGYSGLYTQEEEAALGALLRDYTDIWRRLHPGCRDAYTVWDERKSARCVNQVRAGGGGEGRQGLWLRF